MDTEINEARRLLANASQCVDAARASLATLNTPGARPYPEGINRAIRMLRRANGHLSLGLSYASP